MSKAIGRPLGSRNKSTMLREQMELKAMELFNGATEQAVQNICKTIAEGDLETSKWFIDKIVSKAPTKAVDDGEAKPSGPFEVTINVVPSANHNAEITEGKTIEGEGQHIPESDS